MLERSRRKRYGNLQELENLVANGVKAMEELEALSQQAKAPALIVTNESHVANEAVNDHRKDADAAEYTAKAAEVKVGCTAAKQAHKDTIQATDDARSMLDLARQ
jgi:hypothetical protein